MSCPEIIADYNQFMGDVDLCDQYICYYSVGRKNMKWWRLHDHAIMNAIVQNAVFFEHTIQVL